MTLATLVRRITGQEPVAPPAFDLPSVQSLIEAAIKKRDSMPEELDLPRTMTQRQVNAQMHVKNSLDANITTLPSEVEVAWRAARTSCG